MSAQRHVHIGTGKLGLGFVGYFARELGFSIIFLNRNSVDIDSVDRNNRLFVHKEYIIEYYDKADEKDPIKFQTLHFFDTKQDQITPADQIISDPDTVILTTAVGESHLSSIAQVIAAGLKKRANTAPPLLILACENGHRSSHKLADEVEKYLSVKEYNGRFIDCIVDQICVNWIKRPDNTFVTLSAETYREWVIEDSEPDRLRELLKHKCIQFVPTAHVDIYEIRKLWLVNGFHLALAILGFAIFEDPDTPISKVLESTDSRLSDRIVEIKAELVNALMFKDDDGVFSRRDLEVYINEVEKRFRASPDTCRRILWNPLHDRARIEKVALEFGNALGKDERLSDVLSDSLYECIFTFFGKVQDRLYDPMKILLGQRGGVCPRSLSIVLLEMVPLIVKQGKQLLQR